MSWVEDRHRRASIYPKAKRQALEDAIRELRVQWALHRAAQAQRRYKFENSARQKWARSLRDDIPEEASL
jgi:hypothetical protein